MASLRVAAFVAVLYLCAILWGLLTPLIGNGPGAVTSIIIFLIINYIDGKHHGKIEY